MNRQRAELSFAQCGPQLAEKLSRQLRFFLEHRRQIDRVKRAIQPERPQPDLRVPEQVSLADLEEAPIGSQTRDTLDQRFAGE